MPCFYVSLKFNIENWYFYFSNGKFESKRQFKGKLEENWHLGLYKETFYLQILINKSNKEPVWALG